MPASYEFDEDCDTVVDEAHEIAIDFNYPEVSPIHLLLAMIKTENNNIGRSMLSSFVLKRYETLEELRREIESHLEYKPEFEHADEIEPVCSRETERVFRNALKRSEEAERDEIGCEHLLLGLMKNHEIKNLLLRFNIRTADVEGFLSSLCLW